MHLRDDTVRGSQGVDRIVEKRAARADQKFDGRDDGGHVRARVQQPRPLRDSDYSASICRNPKDK
jgi:hypothetical protein